MHRKKISYDCDKKTKCVYILIGKVINESIASVKKSRKGAEGVVLAYYRGVEAVSICIQ